MIVPNPQQIKELDAQTVGKEGISSFQLMQRAADACVMEIRKRFKRNQGFTIVCGPGNNGGDGLLIAAFLHQTGYLVNVFEMGISCSKDRELAKEYATQTGLQIKPVSEFEIRQDDVLVDAMLGIGLNKPIEGEYLNVIQLMNRSTNYTLSIDVPSGMPAWSHEVFFTEFVHADWVITFQFPKVTFFFREYREMLGEIQVVDIGIEEKYFENIEFETIDEELISTIYQTKSSLSHKNLHGSVLLIGGAKEFPGAIALATKGALLSGVGKTFVNCSEQAMSVGLCQCPEAIFSTSFFDESLTNAFDIQKYNAVVVGPGMTRNSLVSERLEEIFKQSANWVLDADALNLIAEKRLILPSDQIIMTPHQGEFDRLTKSHQNDSARWKSAEKYARDNNVVLVLKGPFSIVFTPRGKKYISTIANAGLAKGGSGDLLSGMIGGYLARGYSVDEAAIIGLYLHSKAAELAIESISLDALTANLVGKFAERIAKKWEN